MHLENKQKGFTRRYLREYKFLAYIMQGIKWMLMSNVYYTTILESDAIWDLFVEDMEKMPNNTQGQILLAIYSADKTENMINFLVLIFTTSMD